MIFEQRLRRGYVIYEVGVFFDHPIKRNSAIKIRRGDALQISIRQFTRGLGPLKSFICQCVHVFDIGVLRYLSLSNESLN